MVFSEPNAERGFTLLEILVALTITGMAIGALLSLLGGSKRLAFKGASSLRQASLARVLFYAVSLDSEAAARDLLPDTFEYSLRTKKIEFPTRKTKPLRFELVNITLQLKDRKKNVVRWHRLNTPH